MYHGPIMAQPFLKLPIVAKLGKPGHLFDDAGQRRGELGGDGGVTIRKTAEQEPGTTADRRLCFFCYYKQDHRLEL